MPNQLVGDTNYFYFYKNIEFVNSFIAAKGKAVKAAGGKVGKAGPIVEKISFPAEKDPQKLTNYVCGSNYFNEGEDIKV